MAKAWQQISEFSDDLKEMFLSRLNENPKADVSSLVVPIIAKHEKELNPFDDPAMNKAYGKAQKISEEAGREFRRVAEQLGDTVDPDDLLGVVRLKYPQQDTIFPQQDTKPDRSDVGRQSWRYRNRNLVAVAIYLTIFGVIWYLLS